MRRFTVLVIALLVPGLHSVSLSILPQLISPELLPLPVPEVEAVVPELIAINPCDACFEYMTALIDQLTEVAVPEVPVHPEVPEVGLPEPEIARPLPESVPEDLRPLPVPEQPEVEIDPIPMPVVPENGLRPLPLPVAPEIDIRPLPLPILSEAEAEESLAVQGRPLPTHIIR